MNDILQYAIDNGIIDLRGVANEVELRKQKEILESHHIWKGKNGYYYSKVNGKLIKKKRLEDLEGALIDNHKANTVEEVFTQFIYHKKNLQPSTVKRYDSTFSSYLTEIKDRPIESITEWDIELLITKLLDKGITAKEYAGIRTVLNGIFKLAKKQRLIDFRISETLEDLNITHKDFRPKQHKKQVLLTTEYLSITEYLTKHDDITNLGLLLMLKTGLRIGELVALTPRDIHKYHIDITKTEQRTDEGYVIVNRTKTDAGVRQVVVADEDLWILRELKSRRAFCEYLFDYKSYQFRSRLYTICDKLGIERIGLHKLRKTYASRLFSMGLDEVFICAQMGHTDITCTKQYYIKDTLSLSEKRRLLKAK